MNEIIYKDPVSFDKNCSLLMRANSVLYQERRKIYYPIIYFNTPITQK